MRLFFRQNRLRHFSAFSFVFVLLATITGQSAMESFTTSFHSVPIFLILGIAYFAGHLILILLKLVKCLNDDHFYVSAALLSFLWGVGFNIALLKKGEISLLLFLSVTVYLLLTGIIFSLILYRSQIQKQLLERELERRKEQYDSLRNSFHSLAQRSHDTEKNRQLLMYYLSQGKTDDAMALLEEQGTFSVSEVHTYTGIESLDCLLSDRKRAAEEKKLMFSVKADLFPDSLNIPQSSLYCIAANLLDNAIEAALSVVDVQIRLAGKMLILLVKNDFSPQANDNRACGESVSSLHGYGLKIVESLVQKNDGLYRCYSTENEYVAEILVTAIC